MSKHFEVKIAGGDTSTPLSLAKRIKLISQVCDLTKVRFLDCGCGAGEYVFALRDRFGTDAWGIEFMEDKVAKAKTTARHAARVRRGDLQNLDEPDSDFDVVLLNEVLEHVPDDFRALREVHRVLKSEGQLIIFSPNRLFPFETHGVRLRNRGTWVSPAVPFIPYLPMVIGSLFLEYWARNYWPGELKRLVRRAGFAIQRRSYFWQTFENISGKQPCLIQKLKPVFRKVSSVCEKIPVIRQMGVSQVIVAQKLK